MKSNVEFIQSDAKMLYQVTDISINKSDVTFELQTKDYQLANILCGTLMSSIPTIAIDNIIVYSNTSTYYDEYLAHRLGLIPFRFSYTEETLETTELELNVHATGGKVLNVTSKYLKSNTSVVPVDDDILIGKLYPGQSLHFKAYVKYGTGEENAKWSPVTVVTFKRKGDGYHFQMETHGMMEPEQLIQKALDIVAQ